MKTSRARALGILGAAALAGRARAVSAQGAAPIRLGYSSAGEGFYEPLYASDQGLFAKAGLNVEMIRIQTSTALIQAALANAIDVGFCDPPGAANAFIRGFPIAYIAGGALYETKNAGTLLCTLPESPIRSAKDLVGQSIGVIVLGSVSSLGVAAWLEAGGVDVSSVKLYELPFTTMVAALRRGTIAAALIAEPVLSQALDRKDVRVLAHAYDAIAKSFFIAACFSTRPWITANPEVARKLAATLDEAGRWANGHHEQTATIVANGSGIPLDVVRGMVRLRFAPLDARLVQPVLDAAARNHLISRPTNAAEILASV
jgi:NitT/TauT family transport system substrate-binding protein